MADVTRRKFLGDTIKTSAALAFGGLAPQQGIAADNFIPPKSIVFRPDWTGTPGPFRHSWEGLVNVDQFRWFVRRDMQEQLKLAHDELGARHVRAIGIFDDEVRVVSPDPVKWRDEKLPRRFNWQIVDYVFDSLLDAGVRPMVTTTFVPSFYASGTKTSFRGSSHITPPRDLKEWGALVRATVKHVVDRYNADEVRGWYFEAWNEPNLKGFWDGTKEEYLQMWAVTYRAIKDVDAGLRVGGPSTARAAWIQDLLEFGHKNDCAPDYIVGHVYNNDAEWASEAPYVGSDADKQIGSIHFTPGVVRGGRKLLDELGFKGKMHWNEWGRSWFPYEPTRESAYEAAWIAKTMAEISQLGDYFAYWCLSDIYDQAGYGAEAFHGNYGLLSLQGLRKPAYHAFQLMGRLGDRRVPVNGENLSRTTNAIATAGNGKNSLLIYSLTENPEAATTAADVCVELPGKISAENISLWRVDQAENNVTTQYQKLGSPAYLSRQQTAELRAGNALVRSRERLHIRHESGKTFLELKIATPGVALLEVR